MWDLILQRQEYRNNSETKYISISGRSFTTSACANFQNIDNSSNAFPWVKGILPLVTQQEEHLENILG